jgi:hypothetical protein
LLGVERSPDAPRFRGDDDPLTSLLPR